MAYQLDYSQAGQIIVTGDRRFTVHLSSIATFSTSEITVSAVVVDSAVVLREIEGGVEHKFDIRNCSDPVYATPEDLMSDIEAQVAAMYAGGGGGGTVTSIGVASAFGNSGTSSGGATPLLTIRTNALTTSVLTLGHGLVANEAVRLNVANYVKAQGDSATNARFAGFVWSVTSADIFVLAGPGSHMPMGFSGLTAGSLYYLDPSTAGAITATPNGFGPVLYATSTTGGYVLSNAQSVSGPKYYRAELEPGLPDPTVVVGSETNELGGTPVWTGNGAGEWTLTITGAFPANKTKAWAMQSDRSGSSVVMHAYRDGSDDTCKFEFLDVALLAAEPTGNVTVWIEVTP